MEVECALVESVTISKVVDGVDNVESIDPCSVYVGCYTGCLCVVVGIVESVGRRLGCYAGCGTFVGNDVVTTVDGDELAIVL